MCWSGGKDSALALHSLQQCDDYEVVALLTTLTREYDRIAMHGVRRELLALQAGSIGLPLIEVWISTGAGNAEYEAAMDEQLGRLRDSGVSTVGFGDLFLQDIRDYRERLARRLEVTPVFPIWGRDTKALAAEFVDTGFRALTCCVDTISLPDSFCGREMNRAFFGELPDTVDPCGENGEFHSFVYDGPDFSVPISVRTGESRRDGQFVFRDIIPSRCSDGASI
ncbi:diphthine--ammonia ligase [bacterium]|nr:diphthine--ammonia ligase [bacterium]